MLELAASLLALSDHFLALCITFLVRMCGNCVGSGSSMPSDLFRRPMVSFFYFICRFQLPYPALKTAAEPTKGLTPGRFATKRAGGLIARRARPLYPGWAMPTDKSELAPT